jgi:hypothetical protein
MSEEEQLKFVMELSKKESMRKPQPSAQEMQAMMLDTKGFESFMKSTATHQDEPTPY